MNVDMTSQCQNTQFHAIFRGLYKQKRIEIRQKVNYFRQLDCGLQKITQIGDSADFHIFWL